MAKIVIVEDEPHIQQMYVMKLKAAGFDVASAEDGQKGLELIQQLKPDLVLLDILMPIMGGEEMLKKLRAEDWGKDVLVLVLTNLTQNEAPMDMRMLRVEKYILKVQYTPQQVVDIVTEILKRYKKL